MEISTQFQTLFMWPLWSCGLLLIGILGLFESEAV
ncbi:hypothetical protein LINPERPRIM_LOCUS25088, partial [Linum perenne]